MNVLTRRSFLSHSATLGLGTALAALTDIPLVVQRALAEGSIGQPGPDGRVRKLLFLFLRGANDGLNAVVPLGDPAYASSRPNLALSPDPMQPVPGLDRPFSRRRGRRRASTDIRTRCRWGTDSRPSIPR